MDFDINKMNEKLMEAIDPNIDYSIDDFNNEFNNVNTTAVGNPDAFKIPLKFVNKSDNPNPEYAKDGDSGFDVRANVEETVVLMPTRLSTRTASHSMPHLSKPIKVVESVQLIKGDTKVIPTGLFFEIPENYEIQARSRSGLSAKAQVVVTNSPGTVDSGYRGELKIILTNHGDEVFHIKKGDRIAQCVFSSVLNDNFVDLQQVDEISDDTDRGADGFGSTGVN
jgi:dUTP pyrophosphatase